MCKLESAVRFTATLAMYESLAFIENLIMGIFNKKKEITTTPEIEVTKAEEKAEVIDWNPQWCTGAPTPQVFSNSQKTYLIYHILETADVTEKTKFQIALVTFDGNTFRFGIANDEVFNGLPLYNKGLEGYSAHLIQNSSWIKELRKIHMVHPYFNLKSWSNKKHFALLFHDEIMEVIATNYEIEIFDKSIEEVATEVVKRMNK